MELRQDRMSHQERINALWNYQKPDRVPICLLGIGFVMVNAGYKHADLYTDAQKTVNAVQWTCEQYGWEQELAATCLAVNDSWDFGATVTMPDSEYASSISVPTPAVTTEDDVWNLKMPDPKTAGAAPQCMEVSKLQEKAGMLVKFSTHSPFTSAANICGVDRFCRWLLKRPELCQRLLRMTIDHIFEVLQYWVTTFGAEKILYFMISPSESNQVISPKHFQEYALPYHKEFHKRLRATGVNKFMIHICGEQNLNLPYLSQLASSGDGWPHPSILSFGHEVDLNDAAKHFPEDIVMGNIEPAVIQAGTPRQVYELCKIAIEKGKKSPGGFILGPGCTMPPRAPTYNVWMLTKAVNDFGWYE